MTKKSKTHNIKPTGLYGLAYTRIQELEPSANSKSKIIRFPLVFEKICKTFSITKKQAWEILFILRDFGLIKVVPYQGIIIEEKGIK